MEDTFQVLKVKMYLVKHMEKSVINQVLVPSTEELINPLILNINQCLKQNISNTVRRLMIPLPKLSVYRDRRTLIRRYY